ncbi:MAG: hypothetical protein GY778_13015, partial [bacterium]|nr:hypothetical protein [bacterium]
QVVIQVDGVDIGAAVFGRSRPGVERDYPGYPDSAAAGFGYRLNSTIFANGLHTVSAKVVTNAGKVTKIPGAKEFLFTNNTTILVPFGAVTEPHRNAQIFGTCDPNDPRRRLTAIEGWALDLGVETNDAGIGYVELLIDNQDFSNSRTGCRFILGAGGFTNCYGLFNPAIERLYPFALDAPNAGFRFVLDVGAMISNGGYVECHHSVPSRSGAFSNQIADVDEIPVVFRCVEGLPNEGSVGKIERPRPGVIYSGNMPVGGWT